VNCDVDCTAEIYANSPQEDGEIYANDMVELQPSVHDGVAGTDDNLYTNDDKVEMEELYQNENQINASAEKQQPQLDDDDDEPIYQNVTGSRKPAKAPKPAKRRF